MKRLRYLEHPGTVRIAQTVNDILRRLAASRFLRFAVVGGAGFFVNEAALMLAHGLLGAGPRLGWFLAFFPAVTFTWWGNRKLTFAAHASEGAMAMSGEWAALRGDQQHRRGSEFRGLRAADRPRAISAEHSLYRAGRRHFGWAWCSISPCRRNWYFASVLDRPYRPTVTLFTMANTETPGSSPNRTREASVMRATNFVAPQSN